MQNTMPATLSLLRGPAVGWLRLWLQRLKCWFLRFLSSAWLAILLQVWHLYAQLASCPRPLHRGCV
eukprot:128865-Amphidinium_carterae.1